MGEVFLADADDIAVALRMDSYLDAESRTAIPVGVYRAGATNLRSTSTRLPARSGSGAPQHHRRVGSRDENSAVEFMLSSIFSHFPASKGSVAAVCFNVKGPTCVSSTSPGGSRTAIARCTS
jgi:hypothetical protein